MNPNAAFKKIVALALVAGLTGTLPGVEAYRVYAGESFVSAEASAEAVQAGALPGVQIQGPAEAGLSGVSLEAPVALPGAQLQLPASVTAPSLQSAVPALGDEAAADAPSLASVAGAVTAQGPAVSGAAAVSRRMARLSAETPDLSNLSQGDAQGAAAADFYKKIGQAYETSGQGEAVVQAAGTQRDASREFTVPVEPRLSAYADASASSERTRIIVQAPAHVAWKRDYHVDWVDWKQPNAMDSFRGEVGGMYGQLAAAGLSADVMDRFDARPISNYRLIGAATLEVPADKRAALEEALRQKGFTVHEDKIIQMVRPEPVVETEGWFTKSVTLQQVTQITGADKVQEILKAELAASVDPAMLNIPNMFKPMAMKALRWLGLVKTPVSPAGSIIDTGNDPDHPMLKGHYSIDAKDAEGHGTWVGSAVTSFDPWQKNLRSYNTFGNGSASTDDILRDLAKADADGAEWFTNSWGDDEGDPNSPDSQLVRKIAEKGKIFFFAAGNAGSGANTVGGPAIAYTRDPKTGTDMIVSVGATDGEGKTASFQSRGPWSPTVSQHQDQYKDYPNRVDIQSVGHKVYGAYPTYMSGADKQDPALGPQKQESGTSMSTPTLGGAYSLLREFGFDPVQIVKALFDAAKRTDKPEAEGGRGFLDVHAAYLLLKQAQDSKPSAKLKRLLKPAASKVTAKLTSAR